MRGLEVSAMKLAVWTLAALLGATTPALSVEPGKAEERNAEKTDKPAPAAAVTHHKTTVEGRALAYTATAATISVFT